MVYETLKMGPRPLVALEGEGWGRLQVKEEGTAEWGGGYWRGEGGERVVQ